MAFYNESIERIPECYINEDCGQVVFPFKKYMFLFGDKGLMYYRNYTSGEYEGNTYLTDKRKDSFPYSSIPEHMEREGLFKKNTYVNQILEYDKPYLRLFDGSIAKSTLFKSKDGALLHTKSFPCYSWTHGITKNVSRAELDVYLTYGCITDSNDEKYNSVYVINRNDISLLKEELTAEETLIEQEKQRLLDILTLLTLRFPGALKEKNDLRRVIINLKEVDPFVVMEGLMVKVSSDGNIKLDNFNVKFIEKNVYELEISYIPITKEVLKSVLSYAICIENKTMKEPKISLSLNPDITKEQLAVECEKVYSLKKKSLKDSNYIL